MMTTIDISQTEPNLLELLRKVKEEGISVLFMDGEQRVAELSVAKPRKRIAGLHEGQIIMSDDFDDPLPDSFWFSETDPLNDWAWPEADAKPTAPSSRRSI